MNKDEPACDFFSFVFLQSLLGGFLFGFFKRDAEFLKLLGADFGGGVEHDVASGIVFREGDAVADAVESGEEGNPAVETIGESTVRWCAEFEGIHEEAELCFSLFFGEAEHVENLCLQNGVMDSNGAAADFHAVADHVIGVCQDFFRMVFEKRKTLQLHVSVLILVVVDDGL